MKKYLQMVETENGITAHIAFYADTPRKNYRVYYCGVDTGQHYEKIGNAARRLARYANDWEKYGGATVTGTYTIPAEFPRRGSNA